MHYKFDNLSKNGPSLEFYVTSPHYTALVIETRVLRTVSKNSFKGKRCDSRACHVTSPCDQRKFWKMLKNLFKNDVAQERVFPKNQPAKKHKGARRGQPRKAEERKVVRKHVYGHRIRYFDSLCAETPLDVHRSLPEKQHDGVIPVSMPGVAPSSSAGAMPPRNLPNSPNWTYSGPTSGLLRTYFAPGPYCYQSYCQPTFRLLSKLPNTPFSFPSFLPTKPVLLNLNQLLQFLLLTQFVLLFTIPHPLFQHYKIFLPTFPLHLLTTNTTS